MARYMRGYGMYRLGDPIVGPGIAWHGPGTYLVYPDSPNTRNRRRTTYALRPPRVVTEASTQVFTGPKVYLNVMLPERSRSTVTRRRSFYQLTPPVVVPAVSFGPSVTLAKPLRRPIGKGWIGGMQVALCESAPFDSLALLDDFNRSDADPISGNWTQLFTASLRLVSNAATGASALSSWTAASYSDVTVVATLGSDGTTGDLKLVARSANGATSFTGYVFTYGAGEGAAVLIDRWDDGGGAINLVFQSSPTLSVGDKFAFRCVGTRLEAWVEQSGTWTLVASANDSTYASGAIGLGVNALTESLDDFSVGTTSATGTHNSFVGLRAPVLVCPEQEFVPGPKTSLAQPHRPQAKYLLRNYVVAPAVAEAHYGPSVTLTRSKRPTATYDLAGPVVVDVGGALGWIGIQLAPSRRPISKSFLRNYVVPAVVTEVFYGPSVSITRGRRPQVHSVLRPPTDTVGLEDQGQGPRWLTYSRRGTPSYFLRPPTDTVGIEDQGRVSVNLTYSRRGKPVYELKPPTDTVGLEDQGLVSTWLAYSRRGTAKYRLSAPVVVFLAVEIYGPEVHLARIKPPPTTYFLKPPTDVSDERDIGLLETHLTYSRRGVPKYRLSPPAVVAPVVSYGPFQWLTYSRRGEPKYFLRPPTVVATPPARAEVQPPWLTYSRRGRPIYFLNPPTRVFPFIARPEQVFLTPQTRGVPRYFLKPPTVVRLAVEIYGPETWLTQIKPRPTTTFLRPPTDVVDERDLGLVRTHLTYSRRGRPQYLLSPPAVVGRAPFRGIQVDLTRIKPRATITFRQAAVVRAPFFARPVQVHLTRIKPRRTRTLLKPPSVVRPAEFFTGPQTYLTHIKVPLALSVLKPPTVVGAAVAFYGPLTTLVRIRPPKTMHFLRVVLVAFRRPHGDVCGFDIATSFVCSLEVPGSQVSGGTSTRFGISGTSRAGSTVSGSEQAGGSASGSDRKAT